MCRCRRAGEVTTDVAVGSGIDNVDGYPQACSGQSTVLPR